MALFNDSLSFSYSKIGRFPHLKLLLVILLVAAIQAPLSSTAFAEPDNPKLANAKCLRCHGKENYERKGANGEMRPLHVTAEKFQGSVHGGYDCVDCHNDIVKIPHHKGVDRKVSCVSCHQDLWAEAQLHDENAGETRLGEVIEKIES